MNAQNAKEFLPLIQAMADGRTIQIKPLDSEWEDIYRIDVYYPAIYYRIKPEPRTFDVWINKETKKVIVVEAGDCEEDKIFFEWERITVQEVIK